MNKIHISVTAKVNTAQLISLNDSSEEYLKCVPDVSLMRRQSTEITKKILIPYDSDISFIKCRLADDSLVIMIPKLELEVLSEETLDIDDSKGGLF